MAILFPAHFWSISEEDMICLLYKAGVKLGPLYLVVHLLAWSNVRPAVFRRECYYPLTRHFRRAGKQTFGLGTQ